MGSAGREAPHQILCMSSMVIELELHSESGTMLIIQVKGIFVRSESDTTYGMHYGYNFVSGVTLNRDRDGLVDRQQASRTIYSIWQPLIGTAGDARKRYLDMLFNHEKCMDVAELENCVTYAVAVSLFEGLKEEHGPDAFFYYATGSDTTEATRIIETSLKKTPVLLKEVLWNSLRRWRGIIETPSEARERKFCSLPEYKPNEANKGESQVLHAFRSFLHLDPRMTRFLRSWSFKACNMEGVECSVTPDGRIYLSNRLLLNQ